MTSAPDSHLSRLLAGLLPPLLAAALLFAGLGGAVLWEPHETAVLDAALDPDSPGAIDVTPLTRLVTAASVSLFGRGELGARLPQAALGWLAILLVHLTLIALGSRRMAFFGTLAFASCATCLFHGRQLTGDAPLLLAQTAATAGLALAAFAPGRRAAVAGAIVAASGLLAGTLEAGLPAGAVLPAATVLAALALTGDVSRSFSVRDRPHPRRVATAFAAGAVTLLAICAYLVVLLLDMPDVRLVTGGLPTGPFLGPAFHEPLNQLLYGWFPWIVVAPLALVPLFARNRDEPPEPLLALALAGVAVGYVVHVFDTGARGPAPLFLALPLAAAVGLALCRQETSRAPAVLATVFALVFAAVLIRDFVQSPDAILRAHGFSTIPIPKGFSPAIPALLASLPFGCMLVLLGFVPARGAPADGFTTADDGRRLDWRGNRGSLLAPLAAAAIGGWIAFSMVPELSRALAPRHALDTSVGLRGQEASQKEPSEIDGDQSPVTGALANGDHRSSR